MEDTDITSVEIRPSFSPTMPYSSDSATRQPREMFSVKAYAANPAQSQRMDQFTMRLALAHCNFNFYQNEAKVFRHDFFTGSGLTNIHITNSLRGAYRCHSFTLRISNILPKSLIHIYKKGERGK